MDVSILPNVRDPYKVPVTQIQEEWEEDVLAVAIPGLIPVVFVSL
jgi:hypothetical protein